MNNIIFLVLIAVTITSQAQPVYVDRIGFKLESIADIDIGWMTIREHTAAPKGKQLGDRIYSAKQIGYSQQFVEWMQQSYLPKGCLGNATYFQNYIPTFSGTNSQLGNAINMHANALPLMYGAQTKVHMFLKKDAQGKFVPGGSSSVITNLDGIEGNWAVVADYALTPGQIKKPLPQNFTLSFELVVAPITSASAKGLLIQFMNSN